MPHIKLPNVGGPYGAPMGRRSYHTGKPDSEQPFKFSLQHVRLDRGGYDSGGAYWGIGRPLYVAVADSLWVEAEQRDAEGPEFYFRADDRDSAKAEVIARYPNAKFYR